MNSEIEKIIKEQMKILPVEVINILSDTTLGEKIITIGKKNGLSADQLEIFQRETYLVLVGLVNPDEYPKELEGRLKQDDLKLDNILNDIYKEILIGVRDKLTGMFNKNDKALSYEKIEVTPNWMQNLDFIISGGDYAIFLENNRNPIESQTTDKLLGSSNILETKNKLLN